jgi:hypothetical protein
MVYFATRAVLARATTREAALIAVAGSYGVEVSQLYHAPWIDGIRGTWLGGVVLGHGFLWSDIACYTVGVALGVVIELVLVLGWRYRGRTPAPA